MGEILADAAKNLAPWILFGAQTAAQMRALEAVVRQARDLYGNVKFSVWELKQAAESLDHQLGNPAKHIERTLESIFHSQGRGGRMIVGSRGTVSSGGIWDDQGYDVQRGTISGVKRGG